MNSQPAVLPPEVIHPCAGAQAPPTHLEGKGVPPLPPLPPEEVEEDKGGGGGTKGNLIR
ncbi:MAG: hypothetical protein GY696_32095 [Gammaproteobacteria bacterium]|nr:hypothetical protein [Gammaproteobacteria bacterium]